MGGWEINKTIDLQRDAFEAIPQRCIELMVPGDSQAHTINITVLDGGVAADLSDCEASAYFILPNGENALLVEGYISGNVVSIVFANACYAVPGVMRCIVRVESDTRVVSLIQYEFFVQRGITGEIIRPGELRLQTKTATPSESSQRVTYDTGYDGLRYVDISSISSTYIGSGVTKKSAQTYTPGTQNQTISAGQYLNGAQTILGDSDLTAGNIKSGVNIFGVTGTYTGSGSNLQTKTVSPSTSQQNVTPDSGYDGLSSVTVNAISTETKSVTPSASTQTVTPSSGKYLTSVTINGDVNLLAENIRDGVEVFGIVGKYTGKKRGVAVVFGDSIFNNYTEGQPENSSEFADYLEDQGIFSEVRNFAKWGSGFGNTYGEASNIEYSLYNMLCTSSNPHYADAREAVQDAEIIYLSLGANDCIAAASSGAVDTALADKCAAVFSTIYTLNPSVIVKYVDAMSTASELVTKVTIDALTINGAGLYATARMLINYYIATAQCNIKIADVSVRGCLRVIYDGMHPTSTAALNLYDGIVYGGYADYAKHIDAIVAYVVNGSFYTYADALAQYVSMMQDGLFCDSTKLCVINMTNTTPNKIACCNLLLMDSGQMIWQGENQKIRFNSSGFVFF